MWSWSYKRNSENSSVQTTPSHSERLTAAHRTDTHSFQFLPSTRNVDIHTEPHRGCCQTDASAAETVEASLSTDKPSKYYKFAG